MKKLKRVYHPYNKWEEIKFNMWGDVTNVKEWLGKAVAFTGDHILYGSYMTRVVNEWEFSCENALTDQYINKKAWIGHAAAALAMNCPEHITRKAWRDLTDEQKFLANKQAERAIRSWEDSYITRKKLRESMGGALLF
jgi:hypothetical protein